MKTRCNGENIVARRFDADTRQESHVKIRQAIYQLRKMKIFHPGLCSDDDEDEIRVEADEHTGRFENYVGQCVLIAWKYTPHSCGVNVGWVVHQSEKSIALTGCSGTRIPASHQSLVKIPTEQIERVKVLMFPEEVCEYYRS